MHLETWTQKHFWMSPNEYCGWTVSTALVFIFLIMCQLIACPGGMFLHPRLSLSLSKFLFSFTLSNIISVKRLSDTIYFPSLPSGSWSNFTVLHCEEAWLTIGIIRGVMAAAVFSLGIQVSNTCTIIDIYSTIMWC